MPDHFAVNKKALTAASLLLGVWFIYLLWVASHT